MRKFLILVPTLLSTMVFTTPAHAVPVAFVGSVITAGTLATEVITVAINAALSIGFSLALNALAGKPKVPTQPVGGISGSLGLPRSIRRNDPS